MSRKIYTCNSKRTKVVQLQTTFVRFVNFLTIVYTKSTKSKKTIDFFVQ